MESGVHLFRTKAITIILNLDIAWDAFITGHRAAQRAEEVFPDSDPQCNPCWNGPCDSYRHCLWSCKLTQRVGKERSKSITDAHEYSGGNPCEELLSDLENNKIGRQLAASGDCESACFRADLHVLLERGYCK